MSCKVKKMKERNFVGLNDGINGSDGGGGGDDEKKDGTGGIRRQIKMTYTKIYLLTHYRWWCVPF